MFWQFYVSIKHGFLEIFPFSVDMNFFYFDAFYFILPIAQNLLYMLFFIIILLINIIINTKMSSFWILLFSFNSLILLYFNPLFSTLSAIVFIILIYTLVHMTLTHNFTIKTVSKMNIVYLVNKDAMTTLVMQFWRLSWEFWAMIFLLNWFLWRYSFEAAFLKFTYDD